MHKLHIACSRNRGFARAFLACMQCAVCQAPVQRHEAGADVRLYLGPGDKLAELWLPLCPYHVDRFRMAYDRDVVECRVASVNDGRPEREAHR